MGSPARASTAAMALRRRGRGVPGKALANPDYDPAATFVWGQMMAVGLIGILTAVEERFGAEGHDAARGALRRVGARIVEEMVEGVEFPSDLSLRHRAAPRRRSRCVDRLLESPARTCPA